MIDELIGEYQAALEDNLKLSEAETSIKAQRVKAQSRLSFAKDALREYELELLSGTAAQNITIRPSIKDLSDIFRPKSV